MRYKNKKRILIVDDEPDVCQTLSRYLAKKKFITDTANNGKEALDVIKGKSPDLVILDVVMPKMGGFTLLRRLKASQKYSEIPVIMLTKKSEPKNLGRGVSLSADFYLPKPFRLNNLMQFIKLVVNKQ